MLCRAVSRDTQGNFNNHSRKVGTQMQVQDAVETPSERGSQATVAARVAASLDPLTGQFDAVAAAAQALLASAAAATAHVQPDKAAVSGLQRMAEGTYNEGDQENDGALQNRAALRDAIDAQHNVRTLPMLLCSFC